MEDMAFGMQYNRTARSILATLQLEECAELQLSGIYALLTGKSPQSSNKDDVIEALRNLG